MWDSVGVALDGNGSGEAGDGQAAVKLREGVAHGVVRPEASGEEEEDEEQDAGCESDADGSGKDGGMRLFGIGGGCGFGDRSVVEQEFGVGRIGILRRHVLGAV